MSLRYKVILVLILVLGVFSGGYFLGRGQKEIQIVERKGDEKIVYKDRTIIVTKTVYPDGRTEERTEERDISQDEHRQESERERTEKAKLAQYLIGVGYQFSYTMKQELELTKVQATFGRRMLGPVWMTGSVGLRDTVLGLSLEF